MHKRTIEALVRGWPGLAALVDLDGGHTVFSDVLQDRVGGPAALDEIWPSALKPLVRQVASSPDGHAGACHIPGTTLHVSAAAARVAVDGQPLLLVAFHPAEAPTADVRPRVRDESVAHLAGGFAHDFNNLLTVMLGVIDNLNNTGAPGAETREDLAELGRAAEAATSLTRQLLAFVRRRHSRPSTFGLDPLLAADDKLLRRVLGENVALEMALESDDAEVTLDPTDFDDVLVNLCGAVRECLGLGGRVHVRTARRNGSERGDEVHLRIEVMPTDTLTPGNGAFAVHLAHAAGSLPRALVEEYGGRVEFATDAHCAGVIVVTLPVASAPGEEPAVAEPSVRLPLRILLVEDDPFLLRHVDTTLRKAGHEVTGAASGTDATGLLATESAAFDLLLTDVVLPGVAGPTVWQHFRERFPEGRVLYMSGYSADVVAAIGDEPLLTKPFNARQLVAAVDRFRSAR